MIPGSVKLPYSVIKGSAASRYDQAVNLLRRYSDVVLPKFSRRRGVKPTELEVDLWKTLPAKTVNFRLFRDKKVGCSSTDTLYNGRRVPTKFEIVIKGSPKQNCTEKDKNSLFHEVWHFLEFITSPKIIARTFSFTDNAYKKVMSFYDKFIYTDCARSPEVLKKNLDKLLMRKRPLEKVNILQELRYEILSEINAYSNAEKLAPEREAYLRFRFEEKLEFITNELKRVFREARKMDPSSY